MGYMEAVTCRMSVADRVRQLRERHLEDWTEWWITAELGHEALQEAHRNLLEVERFARMAPDTYWVSSSMCDLITQAMKTMPDQPIHRDDLPLDAAWVIFAQPISPYQKMVEMLGETPSLRRMTANSMPGIKAVWWDSDETKVVYGHHLEWPLDLGFDHVISHGIGYTKWAEPTQESYLEMERLLSCFWSLVGLPIVAEDRPRKGQRRAAQVSKDEASTLRVIYLRSPHHPTSAEPGEIDYSHRWMVSGHWRNQWHPSVKRHRRRFIHPYIKGPEDKPLVIKDTIRAWVR